MREVDNVVRILEETIRAIESENYHELSHLSNQTINTASFSQDPDNIIVSVIVYSLSKIIIDPRCCKLPVWNKVKSKILVYLHSSIKDLKNDNLAAFRKDFERIRKELNKVSKDVKMYIENILKKARINKASRIYEHGVSMEQTAQLLGVSLFELANYSGNKGHIEAPENMTFDEKSRIKLAMDIFS